MEIDPNKFRSYLREQLVERIKANPSYSLRAFARDLQIDNSALSKVLQGKRVLGQKLIGRLSKKLPIKAKEIERLRSDISSVDTQYDQLGIDTFAIMSDWHHYAILELIRLDGFKSDYKWIAAKIGISVAEVELAIERLSRVKMIEVAEDGEVVDISSGKSTNIGQDMSHIAFRSMQKQLLELSIKCIDEVEYSKRNNTSMTMAIDTDRLPLAMEEIKKFRRKMARLLSRSTKHDQVYNLSIALCPITKG